MPAAFQMDQDATRRDRSARGGDRLQQLQACARATQQRLSCRSHLDRGGCWAYGCAEELGQLVKKRVKKVRTSQTFNAGCSS